MQQFHRSFIILFKKKNVLYYIFFKITLFNFRHYDRLSNLKTKISHLNYVFSKMRLK